MIFESFGLTENPFSEVLSDKNILIDARFKIALEHLKILPDIGNIGVLTARTGVGKTVLLQKLMDVWRKNYDVYYLHLGNLKETGLIRSLLNTLGEQPRISKDGMFSQLYSCLSKKQRYLCLLLDEAQLMGIPTLTDIRLLGGDLALSGKLKIILSGQPLLKRTLQSDPLTDLRERVNITVNLSSMNHPETHAYIEHRLKCAGAKKSIFDEASIKLIYHHTEGVPRRINRVAIKAMINAWQKKETQIDEVSLRLACEADLS